MAINYRCDKCGKDQNEVEAIFNIRILRTLVVGKHTKTNYGKSSKNSVHLCNECVDTTTIKIKSKTVKVV